MSTLVPPPIRTPMTTDVGLHPVWQQWFLSLFSRVGGTIATNADEIETALAMAVAESPRTITDESGAFGSVGPSQTSSEDYSASPIVRLDETLDGLFQPSQKAVPDDLFWQHGPQRVTTNSGWKDLLADISAGRGIGATAPTWSVLNGNIKAYAFSASSLNEIWINIHIPHDYEWGSMVYPHIHWTTSGTNTGVCRWGVEYAYARGYGTDAFPATTTIYIEQAASGTALKHMIAEPTEGSGIAGTNFEPDGVLMCRIFRDAAHANDTLTDAAFGIFADLHYYSDGFETNERNRTFTKRRD